MKVVKKSIVKKLITAKRKKRKTSEYQSAVHYSHRDLGHPKGCESEVGQVFPYLYRNSSINCQPNIWANHIITSLYSSVMVLEIEDF